MLKKGVGDLKNANKSPVKIPAVIASGLKRGIKYQLSHIENVLSYLLFNVVEVVVDFSQFALCRTAGLFLKDSLCIWLSTQGGKTILYATVC